MRQVEPDGARGRPLPHHDVQREVLERGVENLLHHAVQAVYLVDEQHVAFLEVREDGGQVARALDGGAARGADAGAQLVGHHGGERGLAQARGAREQDVVDHVAARPRRLDEDGERFLHLRLAQVVAQSLRAQAAVEDEVVLRELGRHGTRRHRRRVCAVGHVAQALYLDVVVRHNRLTSQAVPSVASPTKVPHAPARVSARFPTV